jgi:23S rRNA pseudouridine1911/1915/1917 synthase
VVDKPAGLVVHPACGNFDGTLVNALLHHCRGSLSGIGGVERPGIVHRIDKDTSGLMIAAKTDRAHAGLAKQFADHSIDRRYRAIVSERPRNDAGRIEGNLGRSPSNRKKMAVVGPGQGKHAVTHYTVLEPLKGAALVECRLETGRTHQVRVHMASIGHPLLGDPVYGRQGGNAVLIVPFGIPTAGVARGAAGLRPSRDKRSFGVRKQHSSGHAGPVQSSCWYDGF